MLARFLAAAGHIALQQVVHLETSVLGEIKRRERLKEDSKGEKKKRTSASTSVGQTPKTKVMISIGNCRTFKSRGFSWEETKPNELRSFLNHSIDSKVFFS